MTADPAPHPNGESPPRRSRPILAVLCLALGVVLGLAALICGAVGAVSAQQAMALGFAAVLLIIAGLIAVAVPDAATMHRRAFRAGLLAGALMSRLRNTFRRPGNGRH